VPNPQSPISNPKRPLANYAGVQQRRQRFGGRAVGAGVRNLHRPARPATRRMRVLALLVAGEAHHAAGVRRLRRPDGPAG